MIKYAPYYKKPS